MYIFGGKVLLDREKESFRCEINILLQAIWHEYRRQVCVLGVPI